MHQLGRTPRRRPGSHARPRHEEDNLQLAVLLWLQSEHRDLYRCTVHYPAGGKRNKREAGRLKLLGVRAGVPDLLCFAPRGQFHGLALELKTGANKPTSKTLDWMSRLSECGWRCVWVNTLEGAKVAVVEYAACTN